MDCKADGSGHLNRINVKWEDGVFLSVWARSMEPIVGTVNGIKLSRFLMRLLQMAISQSDEVDRLERLGTDAAKRADLAWQRFKKNDRD